MNDEPAVPVVTVFHAAGSRFIFSPGGAESSRFIAPPLPPSTED